MPTRYGPSSLVTDVMLPDHSGLDLQYLITFKRSDTVVVPCPKYICPLQQHCGRKFFRAARCAGGAIHFQYTRQRKKI
ncbi:hypothetical protein HDG41_004652 [Paraburkholderia sp. JPY162]|uniref:Uncharacterized protein n=1 Tax=Paraburkholderia youngii TaxID=2782701 RepID=A0A7W8LBG5_9BURK|nr:hypothetical protein [Paraburkholderia youngii]